MELLGAESELPLISPVAPVKENLTIALSLLACALANESWAGVGIEPHRHPPPVNGQRSTWWTSSTWTLRLGLPLTGLLVDRTIEESRVYAGGLSVSGRFLELAEAEIGILGWADPCVSGPALAARGGVSPSAVRTATWDFRIPLLATYSFGLMSGGGCDINPDEHFHLVGAALGLDLSYRRFNIRLLPFAGVFWNRVDDPDSVRPDTRGLAYGTTFEIGVRFPPATQ